MGRADQGVGGQSGGSPFIHGLHQAEIQDLDNVADPAAPREQYVGRLNIPMDQTDTMGFRQRTANLAQDMDGPTLRLGAKLPNELIEVNTAQILHCVVKKALGSAPVIINGDGIGMSQLAGDLNFMFETCGCSFVGHFGAEEFDRDGAAQQ